MAKYCVFEKVSVRVILVTPPLESPLVFVCLQVNGGGWSVLELQSADGGDGRRYRVVRSRKDDVGTKVWTTCSPETHLLLLMSHGLVCVARRRR